VNDARARAEINRRAGHFRGEIEDWVASGCPAIPVIGVLEMPEPGTCLSCGRRLPAGLGWRCGLCEQALEWTARERQSPRERLSKEVVDVAAA
jgi:hypothetical protein